MSFIKTLICLLAVTLCSLLLNHFGLGKETLVMTFLLGVLVSTVVTGKYYYGLITSFISMMLLNFFFTEPRYSFFIYSSEDFYILVTFLIASMLSGSITSRLHRQMEISHENAMTANLLHEVSDGFFNVTGKDNLIARGINYIYENTGLLSTIKLIDEDMIYGGDSLTADNKSCYITYSIKGAMNTLGTLRVYKAQENLSSKDELLLKTVAAQIGMSLDREFIYNERENIRVAMERERLRSTLLRSVAHDLRSPLTALTGASSLLAYSYDQLSHSEQLTLARDINEEITWLTNLVENILNMTRISEDQLILHKDYEVVDDVVMEAVSHMDKLLNHRSFSLSLPPEIITLPMDGKLVSQVIINLLDNAIKHTEENDPITLKVYNDNSYAIFSLEDQGNGIDPSIGDKLFQGFVTFDSGVTDGKRGIGLGLAICKAVVEAHGGWIKSETNEPKGAIFTFALPLQ